MPSYKSMCRTAIFRHDSFSEKWYKGVCNEQFLTVDKLRPQGKFPRDAQINLFYSCLCNEVTEGYTSLVYSPNVMVPVHKFFTFLLLAKMTSTAKIKPHWQEPRWEEFSVVFLPCRTFVGFLHEVKTHQTLNWRWPNLSW